MKKLILGIFVLHLLALVSTTVIYETQQDISYTPENVSSPFTIPLNCDTSFDVSISVPSGQQAVCTAYPSQIVPQVQWSGSIPVMGASFDNILYYDYYGLYFALDTKSWRILAASNMADPTTYKYIEVDPSVVYQHNNDEIPFLVLDEGNRRLYILRTDMAAYYDLVPFHTALQAKTTIPKLTNSIVQPEYKPKNTLKGAKYYNGNLHLIIEDNDLEIWTISNTGGLVLNSIDFDSTFFNVTNTEDITDIVFKDNYAFILDEMYGVYVVKMTVGTTVTYTNMDAFKIPITDARLIEVTGDSLNIIAMNKRSTILYEYLVTTSPSLTVTFNRQLTLRDALRDAYSDTNFLYFITGFQNIAAKHSIPGTYDDATIENGYKSYWPMSDIGAITSVENGSSSTVVVINGTVVTVYNVYETSGTLVCPAGNYKTGSYVYTVTSMQRTCNAKTTSTTSDVCQVKQKVTININESVAKSDDGDKTGLIVGLVIAFLTIAVLVFAYWWFKVRNKDGSPIVRNDVFFRRLSRSPLNNDASNLYKVTMDVNRSEAKDDHVIGERRKSDDFVLGPQKSDDIEDSPSPQKAAIVRGKTFSEFDKPRNPIDVPRINTVSNIEGTHKDYEGDI